MRFWVIAFVCVSGMVFSVQAQFRKPGLEENADYRALREQEKSLSNAEDSIVRAIDQVRSLFRTDTARREALGHQILTLENDLFDVRNRKGVTLNAISAMEQEYIISGMNELSGNPAPEEAPAPAEPAVAPHKRNLVYNDYFKKNLSANDYAALLDAQRNEERPPLIIENYIVNYKVMDSLAAVYSTADRTTAEDAYTKLQSLKRINERLSDSLHDAWDPIFDNKIYAYNYLLDRMNRLSLLSDFERGFRETNQRIAEARETQSSEQVYGYPLQKRLILRYEYSLAEILGYTLARDSIAKEQELMKNLVFNLPEINPEPRNFILYSDIYVTSPSVYNAQNPIPETENFRYGTVYRIRLGVFQRQQPISLFRNVSPLSYEITEDGRYRYCAGAFRELSEAQAALEQMKKLGFRQPVIVVWRDGVFETLEESVAAVTSGTYYRIEIEGEGAAISDRVRDVIETAAPDKEISRTVNDDGDYIYTVGSFENRTAAEELIERLSGFDGISAKILVIAP